MSERTPQDFAIEHAEYMAQSAVHLIAAINDLALAEQQRDDGEANPSDVDAARESVTEAQSNLRSCIYEFRKRRDRAAVEAAQPEAVGWTHWEARIKQLLEDIGQPHSRSLYQAFSQLVNEVTRLASAPTEPMSAPTAEPVATDPEDCRAWCPRCDGTGDEVQMSDSSPDAHEVTVNCRHCDGNGTLYAAYTGVVRELAKKHQAYIKACGEIYFSKLATPQSAANPEPSDAERYRYLRDFYSPPSDEPWDNMDCALAHGGEELDALIDAAIRATKGGKL